MGFHTQEVRGCWRRKGRESMGCQGETPLPCWLPSGLGEGGDELSSLIHQLQDRARPASRNPSARWSRRRRSKTGLPVPFGGAGAPRRPGERSDAPGGAAPCPPHTGCAGAEPGRPAVGCPRPAPGCRSPVAVQAPVTGGWGRCKPLPWLARSAAGPERAGRPSRLSPSLPSPPPEPSRAPPSRTALPAPRGHHVPRVSDGAGGLPGAGAGAHRDHGAPGTEEHRCAAAGEDPGATGTAETPGAAEAAVRRGAGTPVPPALGELEAGWTAVGMRGWGSAGPGSPEPAGRE